ncbi:HPr family phosphocarrier protein [Fictibacillus iocasae]|uniref:HPr family phosphocarrier protein n=1 Tax=Fictibacillus iocasae TaxID=2715437 RepID=A0ABW2NPP0_9BACL
MKVICTAPLFADNAGKVVRFFEKYEENVYVKKGGHTANGKSLLGLIALSIYPDSELEIMCEPHNPSFYQELMNLNFFSVR